MELVEVPKICSAGSPAANAEGILLGDILYNVIKQDMRRIGVVIPKAMIFVEGLIIFERETGFEPATFSLARRHSTAELPPQM